MVSDSWIRDLMMTDPSKLQRAFDEAYGTELDEATGDLGMPLFTLIIAVFKGEIPFAEGRFHAVALLNFSLETMATSLNLLRQAATSQGLALLRIGLEACAAAVWIASDNEALTLYARRDRRFDAPRAISRVRGVLPQLPEFWGALSQATVHPNATACGPHEGPNGGSTITIIRHDLDPDRDRGALRAFSVGAAMLLRSIELALLVEDSDRPGWLQLPGSQFSVLATASSLLDRRYQAFRSGARI